jgi:predicted helicase
MGNSLREVLQHFRAGAKSEREKGTYFERLTKAWLECAPTQRDQFLRVLTFAEWAEERREDRRDTGIDLCAQLADDPDTWCAIQCKFYAHGYRIQKGDIDSFFTASGKRPFARRIIVDTTDAAWSEHAETALQDQIVPTSRIGLSDLEESGIDWDTFAKTGEAKLEPKKRIRPHQAEAIAAVAEGLEIADRGKLIMACGTGKTFTALKIAESLVGAGGRVLYLVPSLALMSQTVREWSIDTETHLRSFAVCSDTQVGVRRARNDDLADIDVHDLEIPATTYAPALAAKANVETPDRLTVVFSTYQSIQAISEAQQGYGLPEFDLIVCDEAHRTTGVTLEGDDESNFVRVHDQNYIAAKKRLYMTATPRIYGEGVRDTAREVGAEICSMDDPKKYGETLFTRNFSWAVQNNLLTDYKVIVLAVDEAAISASIQTRLSDANSELLLDDATKIIGCYRALTKADVREEVAGDGNPMHRALAFTKDIKSSKLFKSEFARVVNEWRAFIEDEVEGQTLPPLRCEVDHVDGTFNATSRSQRLSWLKEKTNDDELCRILSNARCLSEGVDVPALDAIMFLHPRKSQIDVVQSVGRVMRRAEGKRMGYVILPVGVPAGMSPEEALDNNDKYKVVWQILNALRAHDDRLDATINKIDLGVDPGDRIEIIAVSNTLPEKNKSTKTGLGIGQGGAGSGDDGGSDGAKGQPQMAFQFDDFAKAVLSRIVKKCGTRTYWEDWAKDVARIAEIHVTRLKVAVEKAGSDEKAAFDRFLNEIRDDLNGSITEDDAIEMLAQHMITRPVFDALFEEHSFASENPVSLALQEVLAVLDNQHLEKETQTLEKFYASVRLRAQGIDDAAAKQKIVKDLYEKFFKTAFPRTAAKLGIVYTPVEVVDFIIHSVDEVLRSEFGQNLSSEGVHIIDPFVGTGTFITRLLQSGLISPEALPRKYAEEIHANEIALLAYYVAAINIEAVYHELSNADYTPFPGICLTDTFQLYEKDDLVSGLLADNSDRRIRQKALDIRVIIGNPPYSEGQDSGNDNAQNIEYPSLDARIRETYGARSNAGLQNSLFNSYVRALRWASDRIGETGVVAFVSAAGWITGNSFDGFRKTLADEFSQLYVFHLRGNARTKGELRRKEKDNVFEQGSRSPIAITILVKNPDSKNEPGIHFHDIGDYLSVQEKLARITAFSSMAGISEKQKWQAITPNEHGDWLAQRDDSFDKFIAVAEKGSTGAPTIFVDLSSGIKTNRDPWCYNASKDAVSQNMSRMIEFYNRELQTYQANFPAGSGRPDPENVVDKDSTNIKWTREIFAGVKSGRRGSFERSHVVCSSYRPFTKQWAYFDGYFNNCVYQMPKIFPVGGQNNLAIVFNGPGTGQAFSAILTDCLPEYALHSNGLCLPLYIYDVQATKAAGGLFNSDIPHSQARKDGISAEGLAHFQTTYGDQAISREDIFYYIYGLFHSPDYRSRFGDNLSKQLPRIPLVKGIENFHSFSTAGRNLAALHVDYDAVEPYPVHIKEGDLRLANIGDPVSYFRVEKMKFAGKRGAVDKSNVIYNPRITMENIPLEAYEYVVNGKPALDWVMERQCVKTDPASGIVNDANRYANETVGNPAYPLELFQRVITVSLETMEIVKALPPLGDLS